MNITTKYPMLKKRGLNNNAYTNIMTVWVLRNQLSRASASWGPRRREEISESLDLTLEEVENWQKIISRMYVAFHDRNIISQFEGYGDLKEFNWEGYRAKYGNIHRLDRIFWRRKEIRPTTINSPSRPTCSCCFIFSLPRNWWNCFSKWATNLIRLHTGKH